MAAAINPRHARPPRLTAVAGESVAAAALAVAEEEAAVVAVAVASEAAVVGAEAPTAAVADTADAGSRIVRFVL